MRLLVVDDDPSVREALELVLDLNGFGVASAADGGEAIRALAVDRPDAVILDVLMPGLDGLEVCRRMRAIYPGERICVADQWLYLVGIPGPSVLTPEIESSVLVGFGAAERYLHFGGHPNTVYLRAQNSQVAALQSVLAATADPEAPNEVNVSQPSATLTARADAQSALNGLFLGLGAVALLVGAVGVANIMVISDLERRSEIGLRRALGATRGQIRTQFLSEAILLALGGGAVGIAAGALATAVYAATKGWTIVVPTVAWAGGFGAALLIGAIAGLVPALRAARLSPTEALRTV